MHPLSLITLFLTAASAIVAHPLVEDTRSEPLLTNAQRFKRGLPPLPPVARWSPTRDAHVPRASPVLGGAQCASVPQCCNSLQNADSPVVSLLLGLLGIVDIPATTLVGLTCAPVDTPATCATQPACCANNNFNGIVAIGCTPIVI